MMITLNAFVRELVVPERGPATDVSITEARVQGGVGNPRGLTVSRNLGHAVSGVSPDPGPTRGRPEGE